LRYRSVFVGAGGITNDGNLTLGNISNLKIPGGNNGYVIQTDGAGNLSWVAQTGSGNGNPGGSNAQVQFNDGGLFAGSGNFTFNKTNSTILVTAANIGTINSNSLAVSTAGNTWSINNQILQAPSGATWRSNAQTLDEYISSAVDGYLNFQTYDITSNIATELHMEHGLVHINIYNGDLVTWEFNESGNLTLPNIANPSINYANGEPYVSTGSGGVIQSNTAPASPTSSSLWWDEVSGRLYVYYTDADGSQWVDASPAAAAPTYGNANVAAYLAAGSVGNIVPTGNAVYSLGNATNQWNDLYVSNATIFMNNVPISLSAGNVLTVNGNAVLTNNSSTTVSTTGNVTANYFFGNGSQLTGLPAPTVTQDVSSTGAMSLMTYDGTIKYVSYATVEPASGNLTAGNISSTGNISGNYFIGNGSQLTGISGANTGNVTFSGEAVIGTGTSNTVSGLYLAPDPVSLANDLIPASAWW
jgi:hypothetical protein